jgi:2-dehydro-3-deoxyphosphogluconate aldolase/(4S)-4-hydroxy-2-oxoglutarate aldolase
MERSRRMTKKEVHAHIRRVGIVPSVRLPSYDMGEFAAETLFAAGIPVVEIAMEMPRALDLIQAIETSYPEIAVGACGVLNEEFARCAIDAGASFIACPGIVPKVIAYGASAGILTVPGAFTPTEIIAAWEAGSDLIRIFPIAAAGGANYLRAVCSSLPQISLMVAGGVNHLTAFELVVAGADAIGIAGELLPAEAIHFRDSSRIHALARKFLSLVNDARASRAIYY